MKTLLHYSIITLTHRHTPLKNLGQFVLNSVAAPAADTNAYLAEELQRIKATFELDELFYLATCNRILYVFVHAQPLSADWANHFLRTVYADLPEETLEVGCQTAQYFQGGEAIMHLFEVASSIDSLVVGEREILRQLRLAYDIQTTFGTTGDAIRLAMRFTIEAAKRVYSNTAIGEKPVSIVSLAMQKLFSHHLHKNTRYLIVGAGQTNQLVAKFLVKHNIENVAVFNRSIGKAETLAKSLHPKGEAYPLEDMATYSKGFDVLIACTGATEPIITPELYAQLLAGDTAQKIVVDLSIPYNVSQTIVQTQSVDYIEIEQLKLLAKENLAFREQEVEKAKILLLEEVSNFEGFFRARQIELALSDVPKQIKALTDHAVNNLFSEDVALLDSQSRATLDKIVAYLERRCIAIPLQVAKENLVGKL
jgi:glutamyl-tRNA reductase